MDLALLGGVGCATALGTFTLLRHLSTERSQQPTSSASYDDLIVVVGVGGVGSAAAVALVRAGARNIRLIDFDQVSLSSLNRGVASRADVGHSKVTFLRRLLVEIAPDARIDVRQSLFSVQSAAVLLDGHPAAVVDAIDHVPSKIELLRFCSDRGIAVVGCMGAGSRIDPLGFYAMPLAESCNDPLSKQMRLALRDRADQLAVVASRELPCAPLAPPAAANSDNAPTTEYSEYAVLPTFRARVMPVYSPTPAASGALAAAVVLARLAAVGARFSCERTSTLSLRKCTRVSVFCSSKKSQTNAMSPREVYELCDVVFQAKSALARPQLLPLNKPIIVRWMDDGDAFVPMTADEARKHAALRDRSAAALSAAYGDDTVARIERLLAFNAALGRRR